MYTDARTIDFSWHIPRSRVANSSVSERSGMLNNGGWRVYSCRQITEFNSIAVLCVTTVWQRRESSTETIKLDYTRSLVIHSIIQAWVFG